MSTRKVGMGAPHIPINLGMLMVKELNYKGSFRYGVRIFFTDLIIFNLSSQ